MKLSPYIFWDVDYKTINWDKHAGFVISRVAMKGTIDDWKKIKKKYGLEKIKDVLISQKYLDKRSLNFFSFYFNIPREQFRCYSTKQSTQVHWNY